MVIMKKRRTDPITSLNEHDKKVLDKYSKRYTNFIESATAENKMLADERNTSTRPNLNT
jgi:hypothetical protein